MFYKQAKKVRLHPSPMSPGLKGWILPSLSKTHAALLCERTEEPPYAERCFALRAVLPLLLKQFQSRTRHAARFVFGYIPLDLLSRMYGKYVHGMDIGHRTPLL